MISWIQSTFQHHFKLVFFLLLAVMVVPLIFIYSASGGLGQGERELRELKIFGMAYGTQADQVAARRDAQASMYLTGGQMFFDTNQIENHALTRAAALSLADRFGVPAPTADQIKEYIRTLPAFSDQDGNYDAQAYSRFLDDTRTAPGFSQEMFARVLAENWRANHVTRLISGPGYALDPEVRLNLEMAETTWTVQTASLDTKTVDDPGEPSEMELEQWFTSYGARYRIPERMRVSAVAFESAKFATAETPSDEEIKNHFDRNIARFTPPPAPAAEGEEQAAPQPPELADVRDQVIADLIRARALKQASKAAADLAYTIFEKQLTRTSPALEVLLSGHGLELRPIPPFTAREIPPGAFWTPQVVQEAFTLSEAKPVSDPVVAGGNVFLLFFEERIPETPATLETVRDRVIADVKVDRRRQAVVARGEELRRTLAAAVGSGQPFSDAARAAGLEVKEWSDFTLRNIPEDIDQSILASLNSVEPGTVSPMALRSDRGLFIFVASKQVPTISSDDPNYAQTRSYLKSQSSQVSTQGVLAEMIRKEMDANELPAAGEVR